jgi:hypothetical protein
MECMSGDEKGYRDNSLRVFCMMCKVKPQGGGVPKIRGLDKAVGKSGPAFWECFPHMGFTHCKAQGKHYHELKELFKNFL